MKTACKEHGCHFKHEFEETIRPDCPYWHDMGASGLSTESKHKVWEWLFEMPADAVLGRDSLNMSVSIGFARAKENTEFKNIVPGWEQMKDEDRQMFEKEYFKDPESVAKIVARAKDYRPKKLKAN